MMSEVRPLCWYPSFRKGVLEESVEIGNSNKGLGIGERDDRASPSEVGIFEAQSIIH